MSSIQTLSTDQEEEIKSLLAKVGLSGLLDSFLKEKVGSLIFKYVSTVSSLVP